MHQSRTGITHYFKALWCIQRDHYRIWFYPCYSFDWFLGSCSLPTADFSRRKIDGSEDPAWTFRILRDWGCRIVYSSHPKLIGSFSLLLIKAGSSSIFIEHFFPSSLCGTPLSPSKTMPIFRFPSLNFFKDDSKSLTHNLIRRRLGWNFRFTALNHCQLESNRLKLNQLSRRPFPNFRISSFIIPSLLLISNFIRYCGLVDNIL